MSLLRARSIDPADHRPHRLHTVDRVWAETNCYVDVWIELLAQLGMPPEPAGVTALSSDVVGRQWSFLKFQTDDLRALYDIDVTELNVWRSVEEHITEHLALDELLTVEVDSWFLPDTTGTAYRTDHVKTTIIPLAIDTSNRRLVYLHNAGQFELGAEDYAGALALRGGSTTVPHPYIELIRLGDLHGALELLPTTAVALARAHLSRAPSRNPVDRIVGLLHEELQRLTTEGMGYFHLFSFATTRQLGLSAQAAADGMRWLSGGPLSGAQAAAAEASACAFDDVAIGAKRVQFALARAASGRNRGLGAASGLADSWAEGMDMARTALLLRS